MIIVYALILAIIQIWISTGAELFYVLPDDSTDVSCPSQPCATLHQYLLDNNGTLPVVSNVEYHFLLGVHTVTTNLKLENLYDFTIVGTSSSISSVVVCFLASSDYLFIKHSGNVKIQKLKFKKCTSNSHYDMIYLGIQACMSCSLTNISFSECGIAVNNALGFIMTNINVEITKVLSPLNHHGIVILYDDYYEYTYGQHVYTIKHTLIVLSDVTVTGHTHVGGVAISVKNPGYSLNILMNKMEFHSMEQKVLSISADSALWVLIKECDFMFNEFISADTFNWMIIFEFDSLAVNVTFSDCIFFQNNNWQSLIKADAANRNSDICTMSSINIFLQGCKFTANTSPIVHINGGSCVLNLAIIGPSHIFNTNVPQSGSLGTYNSFFKSGCNISGTS